MRLLFLSHLGVRKCTFNLKRTFEGYLRSCLILSYERELSTNGAFGGWKLVDRGATAVKSVQLRGDTAKQPSVGFSVLLNPNQPAAPSL